MAVVSSAERLEVSIDGLTLTPDPEEPAAGEGGPEVEEQSREPPPEDDTEAQSMEQRWGFSLEELYGLALKFFKGN